MQNTGIVPLEMNVCMLIPKNDVSNAQTTKEASANLDQPVHESMCVELLASYI